MKKIIKNLTIGMLAAALFLLICSFVPLDEIRAYKMAKIEKSTKQQIFVFIDNDPAEAYEVLGAIKAPGIIKNYKASYLIELMASRAVNKYPEAEGILLKSEDNLLTCKPIKFLHK